jgi:hypothetical protein
MMAEYDRLLIKEYEQAKANPTAGGGNSTMNGTSDAPVSRAATGKSSGPKDMVIKTFEQLIAKRGDEGEVGATIQDVIQSLRGKLSEDAIRFAVVHRFIRVH